jgi:hypothetical protein
MKEKKDPFEVFFDDEARSILFSLVDRKNPHELTFNKMDDKFEPTISAIIKLFESLMIDGVPDLYQAEWLRIVRAVENTRYKHHRLSTNIKSVRSTLVMSLEDTDSLNGEIDNFELSKKIAGFDAVALCSILYQTQKYFVAKKQGKNFIFPKIEFKG